MPATGQEMAYKVCSSLDHYPHLRTRAGGPGLGPLLVVIALGLLLAVISGLLSRILPRIWSLLVKMFTTALSGGRA